MVFGKTYFEKKFEKEDPWEYLSSRYERIKYTRQLNAIKRLLPEPSDILEVGCAEGVYTAMMARAFPEARIHCIDISRRAISRAEANCENYPNVRFHDADIIGLVKSGQLPEHGYDVIIHSETLYYLFPRLFWRMAIGDYVRRLAAMLRKNGILVTANGISGWGGMVMKAYYLALSRNCVPVYSSKYRDWLKKRRGFFTYELRVFRADSQ